MRVCVVCSMSLKKRSLSCISFGCGLMNTSSLLRDAAITTACGTYFLPRITSTDKSKSRQGAKSVKSIQSHLQVQQCGQMTARKAVQTGSDPEVSQSSGQLQCPCQL